MNSVEESIIIGENLIEEVNKSDDLFTSDDKKSLFVLIRISIDFYRFLIEQEGDDYPSFEESEDMIGDIRSGFDNLFSHYCFSRILKNWPISEMQFPSQNEFNGYKNIYLKKHILFNDDKLSFIKRYSLLLELWQLHFLYLTFVLNSR